MTGTIAATVLLAAAMPVQAFTAAMNDRTLAQDAKQLAERVNSMFSEEGKRVTLEDFLNEIGKHPQIKGMLLKNCEEPILLLTLREYDTRMQAADYEPLFRVKLDRSSAEEFVQKVVEQKCFHAVPRDPVVYVSLAELHRIMT